MATYVLVTGGHCGGWSWKDAASLLRAAGHEVYTPTCTGLGEREHLAHPGIDLDTHITDIANVLRYEYLWNVILVAWSYGGMIITGVAERMPERLSHLVYLDAFVPRDGEALADVFTDAKAWRTYSEDMLSKDIWRWPHNPPDAPRRVGHPIRTFLQPLAVRNPKSAEIPRTFIYCTEGKDAPLMEAVVRSAQRAREAGWRYRELRTGHCAPWTMPEETARLFLELAAEVGA